MATAIVPVFTGTLADRVMQLCDARTLHSFMQVKRDFTTWIKGRIAKFGFVANEDYLLTKSGEQLPSGTKYVHDYHLTLDMAKELAMVENNEQGRAARRYFIDCERQVQAAAEPQSTPYSLHPNQTLSVEQANWLRDFHKGCAASLPRERQGQFLLEGWSKLKSHFGVSYRRIQAHEFIEASSILARHAAEWNIQQLPQPVSAQPALPSPEPLDSEQRRLYATRQANIQRAMELVCDGRQVRLAQLIGQSQSYVSRLLGAGGQPKNIRGDFARDVEAKLGLPALWLDDEANIRATRVKSSTTVDVLTTSARRSNELRVLLGGIMRMAPKADKELIASIELARQIGNEMANDLDTELTAAHACFNPRP